MRWLAVLAALLSAGCTFGATLHGTMFRSGASMRVEQHTDPAPVATPEPTPPPLVTNKHGQVVAGNQCFAVAQIVVDGQIRSSLYPVVCRD